MILHKYMYLNHSSMLAHQRFIFIVCKFLEVGPFEVQSQRSVAFDVGPFSRFSIWKLGRILS
jgi:hypothetical protein